MTEVTEEIFLERLYEVVHKLSNIAKTQSYRFIKIWSYFESFDIKPHIIRNISVEKEKFFSDIDYRIKILKNVADSMVDGFYAIQSILKALYQHYFNSDLFKNDFKRPGDQITLKYLAAKEILGNLIQYNSMDNTTVPLKYNIIAREYTMLKLKGLRLEDIVGFLKKLNKNIETDELVKIMKEIKEDGIIHIGIDEKMYYFTLNKELIISEEGMAKLQKTGLQHIIDWPTQFWRSFYNIRELNFTPSACRLSDFLGKVLPKSATQGMSSAHFVFNNLVKYYQKLKEIS